MYSVETRSGAELRRSPTWHVDDLVGHPEAARVRRLADGAIVAYLGVPRPPRGGRAPAEWSREQQLRWLRDSVARWQHGAK